MIDVKNITIAVFLLAFATPGVSPQKPNVEYDRLADRIVSALKLRPNENVLIRYDSEYFGELVEPLERRIRQAGAVTLGPVEYQPKGSPQQGYIELVENAEVYLWLPLRTNVREISAADRRALQEWLDKGGARREIHFHWREGSVLPDGLPGEHSPAYDAIYQAALDIDYAALSAAQDRGIKLLRSGTVRVRTPAGTDLRFEVGSRPFNKQDGDASPERAEAARVRVDREVELPAGVVRVAPIEESVNGQIVIPEGRFGDKVARGVKLEFKRGVLVRVQASENVAAVEAYLKAGGDAARHFREFGLGFNPKLHSPPGGRSLAYYGYGAGVVRLSLGDNEELGGKVRGGFVRWFFFADATVEAGGRPLVRDGKLVGGP